MLDRGSIMGRMIEDPKARIVKNGAKSCNFGIACESGDTPEDDEDEDYVEGDDEGDDDYFDLPY